MIKINVDFDDVLNQLSIHWENEHYTRTGEQLSFTQWDLAELSKFGNAIYEYLSEPFFFTDVEVKKDANILIDFLRNNTSVFSYKIISLCHETEDSPVFKNVYSQKREWLIRHFGEDVADKFVLTNKSKKNFPADIVIDDYFKNLIESKRGCLKLLMDAKHNQNVSVREVQSKCDGGSVKRVKSHSEIVDILEQIKFYGSVENYMDKSIV